jgi:hypothetical protein
VQDVRLITAALTRFLVRATAVGSTHETRMAGARPSLVPVGSRLRPGVGWLACPLAPVERILPTTTPRGRTRTPGPHAAHRRLARRRVRRAPGHSRVTRGRMVQATTHLRTAGVRDLSLKACGGWQNVGVRLTPRHPMGESR